jgi:L-ascorbate metabolism protein UlaG (beta-lactamase superfamily)
MEGRDANGSDRAVSDAAALRLSERAESVADDGKLTFIGTATTLIRYAGFTILTDHNFLHRGEHARLGLGLRSERLTDPAMEISELPVVDFVVLSHHHGDHFDDRAASELDKDLPIITTPHGAQKLAEQEFRAAIALETWDRKVVQRGDSSVSLTALPAKHAPEPVGALLPPVMGSMLEFERAGERLLRLYITGDTLVHDDLHEIARRYPEIDLSLIHLGGTQILGVLLTMDAEQGVEALRIVRPRAAIPIHYDDYTVFRSPLSDFQSLAAQAELPTELHYLGRGESYPLAAGPAPLRRGA